MYLLYFLASVYLIAGFIYALNILIKGYDPWYVFPINMLGGPIVYFANKKLLKKRWEKFLK